MPRIIAILAVFLLAACAAGPTPQEVLHRFAGHKAGDFFLSYGNPVSKTRTESGGAVYRWVSVEPPESISQPAYRSYPAPGGKRFPVLESASGIAPEPRFCELKVEADWRDIIRKIAIIHDSAGKRSNSICSEIFE